jgi:hypothetical protein
MKNLVGIKMGSNEAGEVETNRTLVGGKALDIHEERRIRYNQQGSSLCGMHNSLLIVRSNFLYPSVIHYFPNCGFFSVWQDAAQFAAQDPVCFVATVKKLAFL